VRDFWLAQVMPSRAENVTPLLPTATCVFPVQTTEVSHPTKACSQSVLAVHSTPSGDVATMPRSPTATNCFPAQVIEDIGYSNQAECLSQAMPSGDVKVMPGEATLDSPPAATHRLPFHTTPPRRPAVPEVRRVQAAPSGEVRMIPESPTATNWSPPQATQFSLLPALPILWTVQSIPSADVKATSLSLACRYPTATSRLPVHVTEVSIKPLF